MIVEFIGSTGAGKTTLIAEVQRRMENIIDMTTSYKVVAGPLGLHDVTHPTAKNLIQEFIGFPFVLGALRRYKEFISFVLQMLARQRIFSIFTVNNLRSLERKLGVHEIIRRAPSNQIILVDEGTVLAAHNLFVYSKTLYTRDEIGRFAALVPLPDLIVYVKAPTDILVQRSLMRPDRPREIRSKDRDVIESMVNRASLMFDQLVEAEHIQDRVLTVESADVNALEYDRVVNTVIEFILSRQLSPQLVQFAT